MKIERINENQIRCTLNQDDLSERQIDLNDLAYGSEKARRLFSELMQTAAAEVGFDSDGVPLMVEAIPLNADSIMLIVTRVEDPDELDTRFSRFSPSMEEWEEYDDMADFLEGAGDLPSGDAQPEQMNLPPDPVSFRMFSFPGLDEAAEAAAAVEGSVQNHSVLYKDPADGTFTLCVHVSGQPDSFRRICNTLAEYGTPHRSRPGALAYCEEHCEVVIASRALDKLARLA